MRSRDERFHIAIALQQEDTLSKEKKKTYTANVNGLVIVCSAHDILILQQYLLAVYVEACVQKSGKL